MTPQATTRFDQQTDPRNTILISIDPDMAELIPYFLEHRRDDVRDILAALGRGDFLLIRRLGHNMKGVGAAYGFEAVTEIGAALEQTAKEEDAAIVRCWADQLAVYLDNVEVV